MAQYERREVTGAIGNVAVSKRVRQAGLAAIVGGILYVVPWGLEDTTPAFSDGGSLYWLLGVVGLAAAACIAAGLWGVHTRYGAQYGRVGRALAYLMGLTIGGMMIGTALNLVAPTLPDPNQAADATLGGTIWGLSMFATLILGIGYGIVLWRADVSRFGAGLLITALPVFFVGLIGLGALAEVIYRRQPRVARARGTVRRGVGRARLSPPDGRNGDASDDPRRDCGLTHRTRRRM